MQTAQVKRNSRKRRDGIELVTEPFASESVALADTTGNFDLAAAVVSVIRLGQGLHVLEIGEAPAPSS